MKRTQKYALDKFFAEHRDKLSCKIYYKDSEDSPERLEHLIEDLRSKGGADWMEGLGHRSPSGGRRKESDGSCVLIPTLALVLGVRPDRDVTEFCWCETGPSTGRLVLCN